MAHHALSPPEAPTVDTDRQEVADLRFEMRMSRRLYKSLGMLANKEKIPKADVIRRSLGLYAKAIEAESQGQLIGFGCIQDDKTPHIDELIRLHSPATKNENPSSNGRSDRNEPFDRFEMRISKALLDRLEQMSGEEGIPKADVIRRALGLYALASEAEAKGQLVLFAKLNDNETVSVVEAIKLR